MAGEQEEFEDLEERPGRDPRLSFVVSVEGFEGPLDLLLTMARDQKVDITQISILELADQYLRFIAEVRKRNLELAADYLVMAAWLAYLKSRLLLPELGGEEEPTGEEMAAALAFQLQRLEAMQEAGARLMARPHVGRDVFGRGDPEVFATTTRTVYSVTLYDLLKCYGDHKRRAKPETLEIEPFDLYTMEEALQRLRRILGDIPDWQDLQSFLPGELTDSLMARSALASTFAASLEMVREGQLSIRQSGTFAPIFLRAGRGQGNEEP